MLVSRDVRKGTGDFAQFALRRGQDLATRAHALELNPYAHFDLGGSAQDLLGGRRASIEKGDEAGVVAEAAESTTTQGRYLQRHDAVEVIGLVSNHVAAFSGYRSAIEFLRADTSY